MCNPISLTADPATGACAADPSAAPSTRMTRLDLALALVFVALDAVVTVTGGSWWPADPGGLAIGLLVLQGVACASVALRRRHPYLIVAVLGGFTLLVTLLVSPVGALDPAGHNTVWAPLATIYAAYIPVLQTRNRRRSIAAVVLLTIIVTRPWDPSVTVLMVGLGRTAFGPLFAMYVDARHRLVRALRERAERAEREQYLLAEQAIASERARIAGEMHDVVSHRVSLMVLQAGALRMTAPDDATRRAAEELRAGGCQALDELRDLVGILRRPEVGEDTADQPRQPEPTTVDLAVLADESSAVGTPVDLHVHR